MKQLDDSPNLRSQVGAGAASFITCLTIAYVLSPHWLTFSHFVTYWYTFIPFVTAMLICAVLLWRIGSELRRHAQLYKGGTALLASAASAILIICIPYTGSLTQKTVHDIIVLLFVLFAAFGIGWVGRQLKNYGMVTVSGTLLGICLLELIFIARFDTNPVYPWVWVVLQLGATLLLILGMYIIADKLDAAHRADI